MIKHPCSTTKKAPLLQHDSHCSGGAFDAVDI